MTTIMMIKIMIIHSVVLIIAIIIMFIYRYIISIIIVVIIVINFNDNRFSKMLKLHYEVNDSSDLTGQSAVVFLLQFST